MLPLILAFASAFAAPPPRSPALVVWMSATTPSEEVRKLADRETGTAQHLVWADITLMPEPFNSSDEQRLGALAAVMKEGRARWDDFDAEAAVARALAAAVEPVATLRDVADRDALRAALLWQGAGITRGYPENLFSSLQDTMPFRVNIASKSMVRPWVDAIALEPRHVFSRAEFPDGQAYARVTSLQQELGLLPRARLLLDPLPPGAVAVLDGVSLPAGATEAELAAGRHYVHVLIDGVMAERMEFDAAPSDTVKLALAVSPDELSAAAAVVLQGSAEVPPDVAARVRSLAGRNTIPPRVFLAALDAKGKPRLVAFGGGAVIEKKRPVTVLFSGELGGGVIQSSGFSGQRGEEATAPQFGGSFGLELGIYNAAIFANADLALAPTAQVAYGSSEDQTEPEDNQYTSAMFRPSGGLGVYLPRPLPGTVWFLLGGTYGWLGPGSLGPGVKLSVGVPMKGDSQTWLRITVDGYRGTQMEGFAGEGLPTSLVSLRLGFGSLL
ncbi:MAG: hypothetical protein FJ090_17255 [Deltaproteobacteria bacterium]|nr:hypothetical protein [Deltaproteobacteria bacterium]